MAACFGLIEREMLAGTWVMGGAYTICDPYLFTLAQWLDADGVDIARFPNLKLLSVDADFGGWPAATAKHFAENGTFDQIYAKAR